MKSSLSCFHWGLMDVTLMRLSCDQRSNAFRTCCSASEGLLGRVLVLMRSQVLRRACSRLIILEPAATWWRNSARRVARCFQLAVSGPSRTLSAAKRTTTAMAAAASNCWRFLILTGKFILFEFCPFAPMEVEGELHRRFAANLIHLEIADTPGGAQAFESFEQRLVIARGAGAHHGVQVANFDSFG